ncbi:MAG: PAS domain-containing sensor histidine kinase, partial [Enterococcus sp.]|nr:PAS domain-containing sensor histidine kinase [Enterococcus sp.]
MLVDARGAIRLINPSALKATGYDKMTDAMGLNYATVFNVFDEKGDSLRDGKTDLAQAFQENRPYESHSYTLLPQKSEQKVPISLTLAPTDAEMPQSNRIIIFRDISDVLENQNQQMDFVATASHEMRTPVAAIEGYLSLALNPQTATIDERAHKYLDEAHQACQHLGDLFRDLLSVTQVDDNSIQLHFVPIEVTQTVRDLVDRYNKSELLEKKLTLGFGSADQTDGMTLQQPLYSAVDMTSFDEILDNLLVNAIKYTPEGGHIRVNVTGQLHSVIISVADNGIGINKNDMAHIFQRFYRSDNSDTRTIGGTGLGLYLVKKRAEAMNGRVWVESEPGKGSTFYVALPR